jgi:hypothetical protein
MQIVNQLLMPATGLVAGLVIGYAFGLMQDAAARRNQQRQERGLLHNGWSLMPGSMTRVAMLLLALALVQVACPLLFTHYSQWCVSGGVVAGYGAVLWQQLRKRMAACR